MSHFAADNTVTIDRMNIPGTHDSGTSYLGSKNYHHTQDLTIKDQLLLGIRYFDIRLRCLKNPSWVSGNAPNQRGNFAVHHEADWTYLYLDRDSWMVPGDASQTKGYVLQDMLDFLQVFPSEFILMQVQQEYTTEADFKPIFTEIVARHNTTTPNNFLITSTYPTYENARGKIVICGMNGILPGYGIQLQGPKLLDTPTLYVENHWMDSDKETKWNKVELALKKALEENRGQWVINFVSDGSGALHPSEFAKYLNSWVENFIKNNGIHKHYGTVLTDFPTRSLTAVLLSNYLS